MTTETTALPQRKDLPQHRTWNAESVFASLADWEAELKAIQNDLPQLNAYQGRLGANAVTLYAALQLRDQLFGRTMTIYMFAVISHEVEKTDGAAAALAGKAQGLFGQVMGAAAFIEPELIALGQAQLQTWLAASEPLRIYTHYIDDIFHKQAHVRSAEVEELLGMLADPFGGVATSTGLLTEADFKFAPAQTEDGKEEAVGQSSFHSIMSSPDRTLRRTAWNSYLDTHLAFKNTLTNNLLTAHKQNIFTAQARRHANSLEASLFENHIPVEVFHNLIETFKKNMPTWQRYFRIRRKALGVERLEPFDMWAPLTAERPRISYEQAVEWICEGLAPLGSEYVETIRKGCLEERWVDVYPNQGKTSGAFSFGAPGTHPFIVMSYTDEVFSLSTLAHELGHSMHSYLTWQNQPLVYSNYSLFVAEVASNFHQAMVRAHLLAQQTERDFQIGLIEEAMANFYRYFLIMPTLARFELETHQRVERGDGFTAQDTIDLLADLFSEVYGDTVYVDRERVGILWATFSHLYADYYVYQYATGISGAAALSQRILAGTPGAAEDYLKFLKTGSALYPLDALKVAGVDLTTPEAVEQTFAVLSGLVDRLEQLIG